MIKSTTLRTTRLAGIRVGNSQVRRTSFSLLQALSALTLFRSLAAVFSGVMDERITPRQAVCITQAVMALLITVFSLCMPTVLRLLCLGWLIAALRQCRREGLGND